MRLCSHRSCGAGAPAPPCIAGPGQRGFGGRGGAAAPGRPDPAGAIATSGLSACWPGKTFCRTGLCKALAVPEQPSHLLRPVRNASATAGKLAVPPELPVGPRSAAITRSCRQSPHDGLRGLPAPGCPAPASSHAAVRAGQEAEGRRW